MVRRNDLEVLCSKGPQVTVCFGLDGVKLAALRSPDRVGAGGFEPPASCSQSRRANQAALRPGKTHSEQGKRRRPPLGVLNTAN